MAVIEQYVGFQRRVPSTLDGMLKDMGFVPDRKKSRGLGTTYDWADFMEPDKDYMPVGGHVYVEVVTRDAITREEGTLGGMQDEGYLLERFYQRGVVQVATANPEIPVIVTVRYSQHHGGRGEEHLARKAEHVVAALLRYERKPNYAVELGLPKAFATAAK